MADAAVDEGTKGKPTEMEDLLASIRTILREEDLGQESALRASVGAQAAEWSSVAAGVDGSEGPEPPPSEDLLASILQGDGEDVLLLTEEFFAHGEGMAAEGRGDAVEEASSVEGASSVEEPAVSGVAISGVTVSEVAAMAEKMGSGGSDEGIDTVAAAVGAIESEKEMPAEKDVGVRPPQPPPPVPAEIPPPALSVLEPVQIRSAETTAPPPRPAATPPDTGPRAPSAPMTIVAKLAPPTPRPAALRPAAASGRPPAPVSFSVQGQPARREEPAAKPQGRAVEDRVRVLDAMVRELVAPILDERVSASLPGVLDEIVRKAALPAVTARIDSVVDRTVAGISDALARQIVPARVSDLLPGAVAAEVGRAAAPDIASKIDAAVALEADRQTTERIGPVVAERVAAMVPALMAPALAATLKHAVAERIQASLDAALPKILADKLDEILPGIVERLVRDEIGRFRKGMLGG